MIMVGYPPCYFRQFTGSDLNGQPHLFFEGTSSYTGAEKVFTVRKLCQYHLAELGYYLAIFRHRVLQLVHIPIGMAAVRGVGMALLPPVSAH
jgi:hypothetical protein